MEWCDERRFKVMLGIYNKISFAVYNVFCLLDVSDKLSASYFDRIILHDSDTATTQRILGSTYLLPARCCFLMSDINNIGILTDANLMYDCIVIDPPWRNKSVKRKKV